MGRQRDVRPLPQARFVRPRRLTDRLIRPYDQPVPTTRTDLDLPCRPPSCLVALR
jgi:hypothetical protein